MDSIFGCFLWDKTGRTPIINILRSNMQPVSVPAPVMQMSPSPHAGQSVSTKFSCAFKTLGILQIVLAGISVALGGASIPFSWVAVFSCPIWGGIMFFLPAGILCILAGVGSVPSRRCPTIACMVMCILSAVMAAGIIVFGSFVLLDIYPQQRHFGVVVSLGSLLLFTALAELVIAIVASAYCCAALNKGSSGPMYIVFDQHHAAMCNQAMTTGDNPQSFMVSQPANAMNQAPLQGQAFGGNVGFENPTFEKQNTAQ